MAQVSPLKTEEKGEQKERSKELLEYNGRINSPMEVGSRKAIFVSATYTSPPVDKKPSRVKYVMKRSFAMIYWRALNGSLERIFGLLFGKTRFPAAKQTEQEMPIITVSASNGGGKKNA